MVCLEIYLIYIFLLLISDVFSCEVSTAYKFIHYKLPRAVFCSFKGYQAVLLCFYLAMMTVFLMQDFFLVTVPARTA